MADSKISDLTAAISVNNTDEFAVVQSGVTKVAEIQYIKRIVPYFFFVPIGDETTALTTGTGKYTFRMPVDCTLSSVRASLSIAGSTSGTTTIDINKNGTSIFTTELTIDAEEKTSETATTPVAFSPVIFADDDEITIDIDAVSGGATEAGLKIWFKLLGIS